METTFSITASKINTEEAVKETTDNAYISSNSSSFACALSFDDKNSFNNINTSNINNNNLNNETAINNKSEQKLTTASNSAYTNINNIKYSDNSINTAKTQNSYPSNSGNSVFNKNSTCTNSLESM